MKFVACVNQIVGIFAWRSLDGRIDGRLLFGPNRVVVSYAMRMSRNASATSTMAFESAAHQPLG
jgi:hypothetical protein